MDAARRGLLLIVASALSFGGVAVLSKLALAAGMGVASLQFWRWGIAFLALAPFALRRGLPERRVALAAFALGFAGQGLTSGAYVASLQHVNAALGAFLLYLSPVFVAALAAALLGERLGRRGLVALAVAVAGLGLMAFAPGVDAAPLGVGLALFAALCYAGVVVAGRVLTGRAEPLRVAAVLMLGATCSFGLFAGATGTLAPPPDAATWAQVALLGVLCTAFSVGTMYMALPLIGAPRAALVSMLEPVSTVLVAYVVLGELLTALQFAGGALILAAVAMLAGEPRVAEPSADAATP